MSQFYNARRTRGLFDPKTSEPFKLSRSKIDLFIECPRCFYLDRRLGVARPPGYPFALNSAVDTLLKKEFDSLREKGATHTLISDYKVDARPVAHKKLDQWRENFTGVQYTHNATNFLVFGAIDDLWQTSDGEYVVVDYKSTSKDEKITSLDKDWHIGYKRQMEIYQWLLRHNDLTVSNRGYFVYCNARTDVSAFNAMLDFEITLVPYDGDDSWVEGTLMDAKACLVDDAVPHPGKECDYCAYRNATVTVMKEHKHSSQNSLF